MQLTEAAQLYLFLIVVSFVIVLYPLFMSHYQNILILQLYFSYSLVFVYFTVFLGSYSEI